MKELSQQNAPGPWEAIRAQWRWIAIVLGIVFLFGVAILAVYYTTDVNVRIILSDPAETALLPEYAGLYSSIGVVVLWTAATVGYISSRFGRFASLERRRLLRSYAIVIGFLALDDLFMWHELGGLILASAANAEDIGTARSALEAVVFSVYILVILAWAWIHRQQIWQSPWPIVVLGGFGFAASIGLDLAPYVLPALEDQPLRIETLLAVAEDLFKLMGIGGLAAYAFAQAIPPLRASADVAVDRVA